MAATHRCRVCLQRIPRAMVAHALFCKQTPAYCSKRCREAWKKRVQRANRKAATTPPADPSP